MVLGIYGARGSGIELEEMITNSIELGERWSEIVFLDDTQEKGMMQSLKRMPFEDFCKEYDDAEITIAVGEPYNRELLYNRVKKAGYRLATIISPSASVSKSAHIGEGVVIKKNTIVSSDAIIDNNVWVQSNAIIGHNVHIKENCQVSSFSFIAGRTIVEKNVYIGASSAIREDTHIGQGAIISMGAIVLKDVRDNRIAMGNPAREIADNNSHRVFR